MFFGPGARPCPPSWSPARPATAGSICAGLNTTRPDPRCAQTCPRLPTRLPAPAPQVARSEPSALTSYYLAKDLRRAHLEEAALRCKLWAVGERALPAAARRAAIRGT